MLFSQWRADAAANQRRPPLDMFERGPYRHTPGYGWRISDQRDPGPSIEPYVRPEFARQMRDLQPAILAAAARHNRPQISGISDHDFAVIIALIMYNEHFGWFEERVKPVQLLTPWYEDLQRETNATGISNLSLWPANIRPSVALEILRGQVPLPHGSGVLTVPLTVSGSTVRPDAFASQQALYAAISAEIANPRLAVEYLAANLERGIYRANAEGVTVTWRALAAWHNQGIVAPEELRANPTASDYVHRASAYFARARALIDMPPAGAPVWKFPTDTRPDSQAAATAG
ncbi:MAG TPA: hypothetical protein PLO33_11075 [Kouleothrix sp.]|uniref:hypothetical protein n=1 Tax=Kouleothrix sp. TaxID=2779161 RepID=UPI002D151148|nr:hypothetical protein [Kouleothrix sp.]HRC76212.1 hypothetical protein [Kouleothrix sp.]